MANTKIIEQEIKYLERKISRAQQKVADLELLKYELEQLTKTKVK